MRNNKKEVQLLADLGETILQFRMDSNSIHIEHLKNFRKEIKKMMNQGSIQPGIAHLLVKSEQYKLKNRINKALKDKTSPHTLPTLSIRIQCIEKANCSVFNQEIWQLKILTQEGVGTVNTENTSLAAGLAIAELMEFVLANLFCYTLLPLGKHLRNKYMLDYKLFFDQSQHCGLSSLDTVQSKEIWGLQQGAFLGGTGISIKIFSNQNRTNEDLKNIIGERTQLFVQYKKKDSSDSTAASTALRSPRELKEFDLETTILSSDQAQEDEIGLVQIQEEPEEQFQELVLQHYIGREDKIFLRETEELFQSLCLCESEYLCAGECDLQY